MEPNRLFQHWQQVRRDLISMVDVFRDDELAYAPFEGSWPVGQIMLHIADCEANWLHGVVGKQFEPWVTYPLSDYPSREQVKQKLSQVHEQTVQLFTHLDENDMDKAYATPEGEKYHLGWILWHVLEHEIHHRGELSLALGLLGRAGLDV